MIISPELARLVFGDQDKTRLGIEAAADCAVILGERMEDLELIRKQIVVALMDSGTVNIAHLARLLGVRRAKLYAWKEEVQQARAASEQAEGETAELTPREAWRRVFFMEPHDEGLGA
ncbi:hypothetical protein JNJ66_03225 [Candidatus Saccharibacteria bacterium]|nr:hypothetical protein [Candidatus Saccharibacteria bacterium]